MPYPRKNNISIYSQKILIDRRQELLDKITLNDTYLPDSILHDDLDRGMLDYVNENFKIESDDKAIPVIDKILTVQRWAEYTTNWSFTDEDKNIQLPFIATIRKPAPQPGSIPSLQRTIPNRKQFHYATVKTWNGGQMGAEVYKMPQPVPVDITYEVIIVCNKFRDLNKFNKIVSQNFSSRQDYTVIKGHYIPIIWNSVDDNSPIEVIDGRKFYVQNYQFTMLGFLIDSEEFEVKPAINRVLQLNEIVETNTPNISVGTREFNVSSGTIDITIAEFTATELQYVYSVGEPIGTLFYVTVNGLKQRPDIDYYFIATTSRITLVNAPPAGSLVVIAYYRGSNTLFIDTQGRPIQVEHQNFTYTTGSTLTFTLDHIIDSVLILDINGLVEIEGVGYNITGSQTVKLINTPVLGSSIGITYFY